MATSRKFTNVPETAIEDPEYKYIEAEKIDESKPSFAPGYEEEPRLGVAPQGEWDLDRMSKMFPEMFITDEDFLDPAEQVKKDQGKPYDETKRFKSAPVSEPGGEMQQQIRSGRPLPEQLRFDRKQFEGIVLDQINKQYGVHPFATDPYRAVTEANKKLPELFNYIFEGEATWSDLPKLDKSQRARWEAAVKEYHAREFKRVNSAKQAALQQYKYVMGEFDADSKIKLATWSAEEKKRAAEEAKTTGKPELRNLYNDDGIQTLHMVYPDGRIVDTGKRTGVYALEDAMPPNVRAAQALINKFSPKADPMMMMMISQLEKSNPSQAEFYKRMLMPDVPPEMRQTVATAQKVVSSFWNDFATKFQKQPMTETGDQAKKTNETGAPNPLRLIVLMKEAKAGGEDISKYIQGFIKKFPDKALHAKLAKALQMTPEELEEIANPKKMKLPH